MVQIDNNISDKRIRLTIRIGEGSMMFAVGDPQADDNIVFEPYELNNSISIAANLRLSRSRNSCRVAISVYCWW